jgi:hypothetical protein
MPAHQLVLKWQYRRIAKEKEDLYKNNTPIDINEGVTNY